MTIYDRLFRPHDSHRSSLPDLNVSKKAPSPCGKQTSSISTSPILSAARTVSACSDDEVAKQSDPPNAKRAEQMRYVTVYVCHGASTGITFRTCSRTNLPQVESIQENSMLPGISLLSIGDYLVSFNGQSVHSSSVSKEELEYLLGSSGVRPAILRFRRRSSSSSPVRSSTPTLQEERQLIRKETRMKYEMRLSHILYEEHHCDLGVELELQCTRAWYPVVKHVSPGGIADQQSKDNPVLPGHLLKGVNEYDVNSIGAATALKVIKASPRPLVLTFMRPSSPQHRSRHSLGV